MLLWINKFRLLVTDTKEFIIPLIVPKMEYKINFLYGFSYPTESVSFKKRTAHFVVWVYMGNKKFDSDTVEILATLLYIARSLRQEEG